MKFTPEGGRVGLSATATEGVVTIAVSDTGIGIAPEDQAAIFEEFRQVGRDDTRTQEGTGLGPDAGQEVRGVARRTDLGSRVRWARGRRSASRCPFGLTKGVRAIRAEASPHGHDVSPVPERKPRRRRVLPRVRRTARAACPSCGTADSSGSKFCKKCGQRLSASQSAATGTPAPRFGSPESYTPKHLAERILTSKTALEGERKQVTVLFADLKGSMELLADRDPEEARKLLDPVLERMMEAVHRYEGTVNQVMGDGIMALFGAPLAHEDHAVRACYAALAMQIRHAPPRRKVLRRDAASAA